MRNFRRCRAARLSTCPTSCRSSCADRGSSQLKGDRTDTQGRPNGRFMLALRLYWPKTRPNVEGGNHDQDSPCGNRVDLRGGIAQAQNFSAEDLARRTIERRAGRGRHLGHAGGQLPPHVPGDGPQDQRRLQPGPLLVAPARLEEPDAHAEPRRDLSHAVLQHEGRRSGGAGDSARRRRPVQRQHHELLAGRHRGCRAGRRGQGQGRQVSDSCRLATTRTKCPTATSPCRRTPIRATPCCARC